MEEATEIWLIHIKSLTFKTRTILGNECHMISESDRQAISTSPTSAEWGTFRTPFLCFQGQGELGVLKFSFLSCTRDPVFLSCSLMNTSHPPPFAVFFSDKGDGIISQGLLDKDLGLPSRLDSRNRQIDVALTLRTLDYSGRGTRSKLMNKIATRWGKKIHNGAGICDGQRPVGQEGQKVTFKEDNEEWESPSIGL